METDVKQAIRERLSVSVEIAAKALGVSVASAHSAIRAGQLPAIKVGGRHVIPTAGLRKLLLLEEAA
jgi:hypothetical protein